MTRVVVYALRCGSVRFSRSYTRTNSSALYLVLDSTVTDDVLAYCGHSDSVTHDARETPARGRRFSGVWTVSTAHRPETLAISDKFYNYYNSYTYIHIYTV